MGPRARGRGVGRSTGFQRRLDQRSGRGHLRARRADRQGAPQLHHHRRHVPALRGHGQRDRRRPVGAVRRQQVSFRRCAHDPRIQRRRLVRPHLPRLRLLRRGQADPQVQQEGAARPARQGADQDQGRRDQPDVRGSDPEDPEVVPVQGPRRATAAHPRVCRAGGDVHFLSGVRRHPAQRGGPVIEGSGHQHRGHVRDADQRPRPVGGGTGRTVGSAAARLAGGYPRGIRGDRARLPEPGPPVGHALGWRGAAHQDDPPPRLLSPTSPTSSTSPPRACTPTTSRG